MHRRHINNMRQQPHDVLHAIAMDAFATDVEIPIVIISVVFEGFAASIFVIFCRGLFYPLSAFFWLIWVTAILCIVELTTAPFHFA